MLFSVETSWSIQITSWNLNDLLSFIISREHTCYIITCDPDPTGDWRLSTILPGTCEPDATRIRLPCSDDVTETTTAICLGLISTQFPGRPAVTIISAHNPRNRAKWLMAMVGRGGSGKTSVCPFHNKTTAIKSAAAARKLIRKTTTAIHLPRADTPPPTGKEFNTVYPKSWPNANGVSYSRTRRYVSIVRRPSLAYLSLPRYAVNIPLGTPTVFRAWP